MSEQRMEVLKLQLQEEVEDPFRAKLHAAEAEVNIVNPLFCARPLIYQSCGMTKMEKQK